VVTWIVVGVIVLAVVGLLLAVSSVTGRLRPLRRSIRRLGQRAEQAKRLESNVAELQKRLEALRGELPTAVGSSGPADGPEPPRGLDQR
jgi:hypothetical protein